MKHISIPLFIVLLLTCIKINAQDNSSIFLMKNNPYNTFSNPAFMVNYNLYIGIPGISNTNFSLYNNFSYSDIIRKEKDNVGCNYIITPKKLYNTLKNSNSIYGNINKEIIGFGFKTGEFFIGISLSGKADADVIYPKDLVGLFVNGNSAYTDKPLIINKAKVNAKAYIDFSVNIQRQIFDNLSIGIRPKLLFGLFDIKTYKFNSQIITDSNYDSIYFNNDIIFKTSCIANIFNKNNNGNNNTSNISPLRFSNPGLALDIGAIYQINKYFGVGLSVLDLGFIKWNSYVKLLQSVGDFSFSGITINDMSMDYDFSNFGDSLLNSMSWDTIDGNKYLTMTNTRILAEGYYDLNDCNRFTIATRLDFINGETHPFIALGYTGNFVNWFEVAASTYYYRKRFNFDVSVGFNIKRSFHIYLATNNLIFPIYRKLRSAGLTFGLLFNIGQYPSSLLKEASSVDFYETGE